MKVVVDTNVVVSAAILAEYLITGDGDFTEARPLVPGVKIVSVREFALAIGLDVT